MTTPYRSELDALKNRKAALEQEVEHVDVLLQDAERRQKRMLDVIQVASPCNAKWDDMVGNDRVRFCLLCDKNVYNLTALPRDEAERFVQANAGGEVCVRFYQRDDGTVMTADCPVGQKKKRRKKLALAIAGAGAMAAAALTVTERRSHHNMGSLEPIAMQGAVAMPVDPLTTSVPPFAPPPPVGPAPTLPSADETHWVAGGMRALPRQPAPPPPKR